ncbi:MAG: two-component system response regulator [Rhodobacteraceae bacterium GWE1_64_9]|nr:MAG: two-component system response regulator [Rhodobacteraceae bacterium GWE1_64_9]OHC48462.1 MAG: two-component system response regulator [Rhodobacteraceae bacterium GWF1_65_7]HBD92288.1 two-component system response regulator [Gemmobacter sp.]
MSRHAMLIEDEPNIAEAIRFLLGRDGWQVTTLGDGGAAEARVRETRPDLLILDLMLPGRSGIEILEALRADPSTARVPVLMLTAKGQGRDRDAAQRAGADLFMAKPFSNSEFVAAARSLVGA